MTAASPAADRTAVYAGHIFRGARMDDAAQAAAEASVGPSVAALYREESISAAYGALAAGSDILFAEAALALGIELHVVLPFDPNVFAETSVAIGNPLDAPNRWEARYRKALAGAASVRLSCRAAPAWQRDAWYRTAFREAAAASLFAADRFASECVLLAISDGGGSVSPGGTASAIADWRERGRRLRTLPATGVRPDVHDTLRTRPLLLPVLFLRPADDEGAKRLAAIRPALGEGRIAVELAAGGLAILFDLATDTIAAARLAADPSLRTVCDFGLVCAESGAHDPAAITSLAGAGDLIGTPTGEVLATPSFALEARFESDAIARLFASDTFAGEARFTPLRLFGV